MKNVFILIILSLYFPFKLLSQENPLLCSTHLERQIRPGDIYLHKKLRLADGKKMKKFLVAINFSLNEDVYFLKPTTKPRYDEIKMGCMSNAYMLPYRRDYFKRTTWIDFKEIYRFKIEDLLIDKSHGLMSYEAALRIDTIRDILECFLKSQYFKNAQRFSSELRSQQALKQPVFDSVVQALNSL